MEQVNRMGSVLAVALTVGVLAGCQGEAGPIWTLKEYPASTTVFKTELEVIPNAQLVRVDSRPVSKLGRMAFTRGVDKVIVATRITAWADPVPVDWMGNPKTPEGERPLHVHEIERAWIAIPYGTPVGQRLQLEELDTQFQTGYDHHEEDSDGFYNKPYGMEGSIAILEEKPDVLVVEMNLEIRPKHRTNWTLRGQQIVPITYKGMHARMIEESDQLIVQGIRRGERRMDVPIRAPLHIDGANVTIDGIEPTSLASATSLPAPASPSGQHADADDATTDDLPAPGANNLDPTVGEPGDVVASNTSADRDPLSLTPEELITPRDPNDLNLNTNLFPDNGSRVPGPNTAPAPRPLSPTAPAAPAPAPDAASNKTDKTGIINPNAGVGDTSVDPDAAQAQAEAEAAADTVPTEIDGKSIVGQWYVNTTGHEFRWQFYEDGMFIYAVNRGAMGALGTEPPTWNAGKFRLRSSYIIMNTHRYFKNNKDETENMDARFALAKLSWEKQGEKEHLVVEGDLKGELGRVKLRLYRKDFINLNAFELTAGRPNADPVDQDSRVSGPDR